MKKYILGALSIFTLALSIFIINLVWFRPFSLDMFYERVFIEVVLQNPELISVLGLPGSSFFSDELNDYSEGFKDDNLDQAKNNLAMLLAYDVDAMSDEQKRSRDILIWFYENTIDADKFRHHLYSATQQKGVQQDLTDFMVGFHSVNKESDLEDYLSRLNQYPRIFSQVQESLLIEEKMDIIPPIFMIDKILEGMTDIVESPVEEDPLYADFMQKLDRLEAIPESRRNEFKTRLLLVLNEKILPAYQGYITYYTALREKSTDDDGAWKLPDGERYYQSRIRNYTTTDYSAEELHAIGLSEVERIETEMQAILVEMGIEGMSVGQAMIRLADDPRYFYPDTPAGRAQILADYQTIIDEINAGVSVAFRRLPKAGVEVLAVPGFKEKTAAGGYYSSPAMDGSRPGRFYANLYDIKATQKFGMRTLAYHEAVPGHHFQIAIAQELEGLPTFRRVVPFASYVEGWALYAEQLAWELGYQSDPMDNLGRLQAELFRAVRLVVDTGIHHKRWTREQAIDYMREKTGNAESDVISEIERYIANPGQALAYKVGMLKILELRKKAKAALGESFDLSKFHDAVLAHGQVPMTILEQLIDEYIAEE